MYFFSHREFDSRSGSGNLRAGTSLRKGGAAHCHVERRRKMVVDMGLICPPAIVSSPKAPSRFCPSSALPRPFVNGVVVDITRLGMDCSWKPDGSTRACHSCLCCFALNLFPSQRFETLQPVLPPSLVLFNGASSTSVSCWPGKRRLVASCSDICLLCRWLRPVH